MKKLARANERARETDTRRLTLNRAARVLEGLLSDPLTAPSRKKDHPISSSHRLRGKNG